jgi:hypothetical protein
MRKTDPRPLAEGFLRLIPEDPLYMPPQETHQSAAALFKELLPGCDYVLADTGPLRFFERGELFMRVACPACSTSLDEWWPHANYSAWMNSFKVLQVTVPCCAASLSLNNLHYQWPAGFGLFALEAHHPGMEVLPAASLNLVETILCCQLRQIFALF